MSLLSRLFGRGGGSPAAPETHDYEGYTITPSPTPEGARWRVGARIEKVIDGETKVHTLIRADVLDGEDVAKEVSLSKAKSMIDQMGDQIFS